MPRKKSTSKKAKIKKATKSKKTKLESLSQTHGKVQESTPYTLDQIWGDDGVWKYSTMKVEIYQRQLKEYNVTDLQRHASKFGIIPVESRVRLEETLLKEFKKHVSAYNVPPDPVGTTEISEEAAKILKEGR